MATEILRCLCIALSLASVSRAGLLRVPKVYNAIISSSDNLTPSQAYPLIQPVLHEAPLPYPLGPFVYQQHPSLHQTEIGEVPKAIDESEKNVKKQPTLKGERKPESDTLPAQKDVKAPESPLPNQPTEAGNPLKLNENGLPPSLIPVQQYSPKVTYQYDPYSPFNPYYSDPYGGVLLPYNNPYSPYYQPAFSPNPFGPYVLAPPFYSATQGQADGVGVAEHPQWPSSEPAPWAKPLYHGPKEEQSKPQPPSQEDVNIKNISNKNSNIPDVPPPPLPIGGTSKNPDTNSSR